MVMKMLMVKLLYMLMEVYTIMEIILYMLIGALRHIYAHGKGLAFAHMCYYACS